MTKALELKANVLAIKNAKARGDSRATEYRIAGHRGLTLRVEQSGKAAFYVRYKDHGTDKRLRLGSRDDMTLEEATTAAADARRAVREGTDVAAATQAAKTSLSLKALWEAHLADPTCKLAETTRRSHSSLLGKHIFGVLGNTPCQLVSRSDIATTLHKIESPFVQGITLSALRALYRWAGYRNHVPLDFDPTLKLKFGMKAEKRERVYSRDELISIWHATDTKADSGITDAQKEIVRIVLLTGARVSAITQAQVAWLEGLDGSDPWLSVPKGFMKDRRRGWKLPLTPELARLFRVAIRANGGSSFVWPNRFDPSKPIGRTTTSTLWNRSRKDLGLQTEDMDSKAAPHLHDARHTIITWMNDSDVDPRTARIIAHHSGLDIHDKNYNHALRVDDVRKTLANYEAHIRGLVEAAQSRNAAGAENVVCIGATRTKARG